MSLIARDFHCACGLTFDDLIERSSTSAVCPCCARDAEMIMSAPIVRPVAAVAPAGHVDRLPIPKSYVAPHRTEAQKRDAHQKAQANLEHTIRSTSAVPVSEAWAKKKAKETADKVLRTTA